MDVTSYLLGKKAGGGSSAVLIDKNISTNGTYNASSDEADGYKKVVVDVQPNLQDKSITISENTTTTIRKDTGYDGLGTISVTTNVPTSSVPDWSEIGYSSTPQSVINSFNYSKNIYDNWDVTKTSYYNYWNSNSTIRYFPVVDTSNVTDFNGTFKYSTLEVFPLVDTSNVTNLNETFYGTSLKSFPQIDTSKVTNFNSTFQSTQIETIPELDASSCTTCNYTFNYCTNLVNFGGLKNLGMSFDTSIGYHTKALDLQWSSNLTHDSLVSIINNLYDINSLGIANQMLTIGTTNKNKLTAEEIAVATAKGWDVS